MSDFKGRNLISCQDWSVEDLTTVLELSKDLKKKFKKGEPTKVLPDKTFFMMFFATSTRTRNSFEAALTQLGGHAHYLETKTMRLGDPAAAEAMKDTVIVLSRYGHGIGVRMYTPKYGEAEAAIRDIAKHATVPVISMESDIYHPCQALADLLTIQEKFPSGRKIKYVQAWAYSPGARRVPAVPTSNVLIMPRFGMDVVYVRPKEFALDPKIIEQAKTNAREHGTSFEITDDLDEALEGADVVYMRNHASLKYGDHGPEKEQAIIDQYKKWTLTDALMEKTAKDSKVMHCLPVDRDNEVTSSVLDGPRSAIYDEAENRLHVQKAILSLVM
ncbi:MAG: ornithine carbamoyltransferase [Candidatus Ranarchaeia archaeon]|jgi:N-acetylornithine carbamoyltransferase